MCFTSRDCLLLLKNCLEMFRGLVIGHDSLALHQGLLHSMVKSKSLKLSKGESMTLYI